MSTCIGHFHGQVYTTTRMLCQYHLSILALGYWQSILVVVVAQRPSKVIVQMPNGHLPSFADLSISELVQCKTNNKYHSPAQNSIAENHFVKTWNKQIYFIKKFYCMFQSCEVNKTSQEDCSWWRTSSGRSTLKTKLINQFEVQRITRNTFHG